MHSPEELGNLAQPVMKIKKQVHGPQAEKQYKEKVKRFWKTIRQKIIAHKINTPEICQKLHIYVDGLPLPAQQYYCKECFEKSKKQYFMAEIQNNQIKCPKCGRTAEITKGPLNQLVAMFIKEKIPFYLIIEKLMKKGAAIHGTESLPLLIQEKQLWENVAKGISQDQKEKDLLLKQRDEFVANQINQTLPENELGLLFIGGAHKVDQELKKISDIKIIYLQGGV